MSSGFKPRVDKEMWMRLRHELGYPKCKDKDISIIVGQQFIQFHTLGKDIKKLNRFIYGRTYGVKRDNKK